MIRYGTIGNYLKSIYFVLQIVVWQGGALKILLTSQTFLTTCKTSSKKNLIGKINENIQNSFICFVLTPNSCEVRPLAPAIMLMFIYS